MKILIFMMKLLCNTLIGEIGKDLWKAYIKPLLLHKVIPLINTKVIPAAARIFARATDFCKCKLFPVLITLIKNLSRKIMVKVAGVKIWFQNHRL